jgi:hypothetical protein
MPDPRPFPPVHTLPIDPDGDSAHASDGLSCWCQPDVLNACPECPSDFPANPICFFCAGVGWVPYYRDDLPTHVIHREVDDIITAENL